MWLKVLLSLLVVAFCTALGFFAAAKYRSRRRFFGQFCAFNERFLNELDYARKPLSAFLAESSYTGDFGKSVKAFDLTRRNEFGYGYLTKEERAFCEDYFSMLGRGDALSQRGYFASRSGTLGEKRDLSRKEAKERGELYCKLGLLAGLAFVILII